MSTPFQLVSQDAQDALREFSTEFASAFALADVVPWARTFGVVYNTKWKATFPIPISAAGFNVRQGDDKIRDLFEKSFSLLPYEWEDAIRARTAVIEAPDFVGWGEEPSRIALEAARQPNQMVATMLESAAGVGPTLAFDNLALFHDAHLINPTSTGLGTFDNNRSSPAYDVTMLELLMNYFDGAITGGVKGFNGKPISGGLTHILAPRSSRIRLEKLLNGELMYNSALVGTSNTVVASENLYKGKVQLVICDELSTADVIYGINAKGPKPWVIADGGSPEEIVYDKTSELWKDTGMVAQKYILTMGTGAAVAQSICRLHIGGAE